MNRIIVTVALLCLALPAFSARAQGFLMPTPDMPRETFTLENQRVLIAIEDGVASYQVDQVFRNNTPNQLEATFYFPLPEGAALSEFAMWINGKKTKGEILERQQAVQVYEEIVRRMIDPGILEYVGRDLIKARIFPIPANGTQKIQVSFESLVPITGQLAEVIYPLRAPEALSGTRSDLTVMVELHSAIPVKSVYSPTHPVDVTRDGDVTLAGFEQGGARFDQDFKLYYTLSREPVGVSVVTYRVPGEDGYFLLMAAPGEETSTEPMPKDITFVVDTSGSMAGDKIRGAREALRFCLQSLSPKDRFNVVRFSTGVEPFSSQLVNADQANVGRALSFVERFEALGGTNISEALDTALSHQVDGNRPYYIVFLTDGLPTVGITNADSILQQTRSRLAAMDGQVRCFTFGVGYDVNTDLLDTLAAENRGTSEYLEPGEDLEVKVSTFYRKVSRPVLADVGLDLAGADAYDIYPRETPDLFSGTQMIVMGRYKGKADQKVTLAGVAGGKKKEYTTTVHFDASRADHEFIPRMWAKRKVGYLLDEIRRNGEQQELVDEVITLSKRFGIMTPYTSFLVVDDVALANNQPVSGPAITMPSTGLRGGEDRGRGWGGTGAAGGATRTDSFSRDTDGASFDMAEEREFDEDDMSGWFDASPADEPAAAAPRASRSVAKKAARESSKMGGFGSSTGQAAVETSETLSEMKDAEKQEEYALSRVVRSKLFHFRDGSWIDETFQPSMQTLSVKYLSDAYFALLRINPDLRSYASLGNSVTIVVGNNKAVVITPGGDEPSDAEINKFLR